jgi:hypothetical protein
MVLLQATSPFRLGQDIDEAVALWFKTRDTAPCRQGILSVSSPGKPAHWLYRQGETGCLERVLPPGGQYVLPNGALYVFATQDLMSGAIEAVFSAWPSSPASVSLPWQAYVMPLERSVDIDTWHDVAWAEALLSRDAALAQAIQAQWGEA